MIIICFKGVFDLFCNPVSPQENAPPMQPPIPVSSCAPVSCVPISCSMGESSDGLKNRGILTSHQPRYENLVSGSLPTCFCCYPDSRICTSIESPAVTVELFESYPLPCRALYLATSSPRSWPLVFSLPVTAAKLAHSLP